MSKAQQQKSRFRKMRPHSLYSLIMGEDKEGYWNYNHMVLQFEDAIDVLKVMFPEQKLWRKDSIHEVNSD